MFETTKSRREFFQAMQGGRINATLLSKAMAQYKDFADVPAAEVVWTLSHPSADFKKFGTMVLSVSTDPEKLDRMMDLYRKETRKEVLADLAGALSQMPPDQVLALMGKMVNDKNVAVRMKAMNLLLRIPNWHKQKTLVNVLLEDPDDQINQTMLQQVVKNAPKAYKGTLRHYAGTGNDKVRELSLKALISLKDINFVDLFLERFPCEQGPLQKELFNAIVGFIKQDPAAMTEKILQALSSNDNKVRKAALELFVKLPDQPAVFKQLLDFVDGVSAFLRDRIFEEAARHGEHFAKLVLHLFQNQKDPHLRLQAMNLAKILKHPKLASIFIAELKNPEWLVRYNAMMTLGDMKAPEAVPHLIEALNSQESAMAAIQALDKYRDMRLAKQFFQKMPKANSSEQIALLEALGHLGDPRFIPYLEKFLGGATFKDDEAKKAAVTTITDICKAKNQQVPDSVEALRKQLFGLQLDDLPDLGLKLSED